MARSAASFIPGGPSFKGGSSSSSATAPTNPFISEQGYGAFNTKVGSAESRANRSAAMDNLNAGLNTKIDNVGSTTGARSYYKEAQAQSGSAMTRKKSSGFKMKGPSYKKK